MHEPDDIAQEDEATEEAFADLSDEALDRPPASAAGGVCAWRASHACRLHDRCVLAGKLAEEFVGIADAVKDETDPSPCLYSVWRFGGEPGLPS